jgi:hypothetical protein
MATSPFSYVWLLPLLERPRQDVEGDVQAALDSLPLKQPLEASHVSLREVIATAFGGSDYWARLAADWLESGFPLDAELVAQIDAGVNSEQWEQNTRHRLYRLARRSGRR